MFPGLLRGGLALALTLTCVVTSMAARREEPSFRGIQLSDEVVKTNLSHMFKTIAQIESENKITIRGFNKENITNALVNYTDSIKQIERDGRQDSPCPYGSTTKWDRCCHTCEAFQPLGYYNPYCRIVGSGTAYQWVHAGICATSGNECGSDCLQEYRPHLVLVKCHYWFLDWLAFYTIVEIYVPTYCRCTRGTEPAH